MIPLVKPFLPPKEVLMPKLEEILYSGYIAQGEKVEQFEGKLSEYFLSPNILSVNSGTAALHLALHIIGLSEGDEVISTPLTAEPTNTTIGLTRASIVWADVEPETGLICPKSIESKITERTRAIVIVHYAGMVADLESIYKIAKAHRIPVIEDCAHAFGAKYKGKKLGYYSDFAIYSFQAIKHITTVDGGILICKDDLHYLRAKKLRWFGLDKSVSRENNNITESGYKYHMNDVNATIGLCQLDFLNENVLEYIRNGHRLDEMISNPKIIKIDYHRHTSPSFWLYTLLTDNPDDFNKYMMNNGIMASQLHKRNDHHEIFPNGIDLEGLDIFCRKFTHIGCGPWMTPHIDKIVTLINNY